MLYVYTTPVKKSEAPDSKSRKGLGSKNDPDSRHSLILQNINSQFKDATVIIDDSSIVGDIPFVHDIDYINFLSKAYENWRDKGNSDEDWSEDGGLVPHEFFHKIPHDRLNCNTPTYKLAGYYGTDTMTPIYADTFQKACMSAQRAYAAGTKMCKMNIRDVIYVLTNVPGHHAKTNQYGGYCFFNNAMIAALASIRNCECDGSSLATVPHRYTILDLDYHAGNGTAQIIHAKPCAAKHIMAISIHADPKDDYPSYEGFHDDYPYIGNIRNVIVHQPNAEEYCRVIKDECIRIREYGTTALIIAFGADTYHGDPDVRKPFKLNVEDYYGIGKLIRNELPSVKILVTSEGGYNLDVVPAIVCNFLKGLLSLDK
jgi:acetoin utilization deacetylase AcuC-like enzyme